MTSINEGPSQSSDESDGDSSGVESNFENNHSELDEGDLDEASHLEGGGVPQVEPELTPAQQDNYFDRLLQTPPLSASNVEVTLGGPGALQVPGEKTTIGGVGLKGRTSLPPRPPSRTNSSYQMKATTECKSLVVDCLQRCFASYNVHAMRTWVRVSIIWSWVVLICRSCTSHPAVRFGA